MDDIFGLIIIIAAVAGAVAKSSKKTQREKKGKEKQVTAQQMAQKQREIKQRLQQKYGSTAESRTQSAIPLQSAKQQAVRQNTIDRKESEKQQAKTDILCAANANVLVNQKDELRAEFREMSAENGSVLCHDEVETSALMQQINDLMITGYRGTLSFERDFVSEGIEMLNSYELADTI